MKKEDAMWLRKQFESEFNYKFNGVRFNDRKCEISNIISSLSKMLKENDTELYVKNIEVSEPSLDHKNSMTIVDLGPFSFIHDYAFIQALANMTALSDDLTICVTDNGIRIGFCTRNTAVDDDFEAEFENGFDSKPVNAS